MMSFALSSSVSHWSWTENIFVGIKSRTTQDWNDLVWIAFPFKTSNQEILDPRREISRKRKKNTSKKKIAILHAEM